MSDEKNRRTDATKTDANSAAPEKPGESDAVIAALRDIPRLRSIEEEAPGKFRPMHPPPPLASRISGLAQGCGGILMLILGFAMIRAALNYGFYLWGPGLILVSGLLVVFATLGVWRGYRVPVIVSITTLFVAMLIGYQWQSFMLIAGQLSSLGTVGMLIGPAVSLIVLVLVAALASNLISLIYWRRLIATTTRGVAIWSGVAIVLIALALGLHFSQQQQRETWLQDHYDEWRTEAATDSLNLGSSLSVTLGYTFTTQDESSEDYFDVYSANLAAAVDAGASIVRITASGDMLLEVETPMLFEVDEEDEEDVQAEADRITRQLTAETAFMDELQASGVALALVDYQYSPYLLMRSYDTEESMPWVDFIELQETRVRHYAALYQPAYYEIVNEPSQYAEYSAVEDPEGENIADAWIAQTMRLITAVKEESPDTKIGVSVALQRDLDEEYYQKVLELDGIDFIGFRVYQAAAFEVLDDFLLEFGHPGDYGKELWLNETWFGACLAPQRSQKLDGLWLETTTAYAAKSGVSTVLSSDFGCFVTKGGSRLATNPDQDERTDVWKTWRDLVAQWQGS